MPHKGRAGGMPYRRIVKYVQELHSRGLLDKKAESEFRKLGEHRTEKHVIIACLTGVLSKIC